MFCMAGYLNASVWKRVKAARSAAEEPSVYNIYIYILSVVDELSCALDWHILEDVGQLIGIEIRMSLNSA